MNVSHGERPKKPGDFLKEIYQPQPYVPDPSQDFGMYAQMDVAFSGLRQYLDDLRSNEGRLGHGAQNKMSDLSKAYIKAVQCGDEEEIAYISRAMEDLVTGLEKGMSNKELAESGNRYSRTVYQERWEAELCGKIWPVITGKASSVPELVSWKDFRGNVQSYVYGFLEIVSELGKALTDELFFDPDLTTEGEFVLFGRYLAVADSIALRLAQERHAPGYVINNGYDRWTSFSKKLRTAYGTIASIRRDYNLRRSLRRMIQEAVKGSKT